ncbi:MAG: hypothetical protein AB2L24_18905 [Mangrovibacterium sp.]
MSGTESIEKFASHSRDAKHYDTAVNGTNWGSSIFGGNALIKINGIGNVIKSTDLK